MPAPKDNNYAKGNSGGGAPVGNSNAVGNSGGHGGPPDNTNALKHGVYARPESLLDELDGPARAWVDHQYKGYMGLVPFGEDDPRAERVLMLCVMSYQERVARREVLKDGMIVETPTGETGPDGEPVMSRAAHPLLKEASRLNRDIRRGLCDLGVLPTTAGGRLVRRSKKEPSV